MLRTIAGVGALVLLSSTAAAQESESAFRFGIGAGKVTIEADEVDLKGDAWGWEIFGGYEFNRYIAVEVSYLDGGEADDVIGEGVKVVADTYGYAASVIGSLPVSDSVSVYARAGFLKWKADESLKVDGEPVLTEKVDGSDPIFGVGVAGLLEGAWVRLEYRIADIDDTDLSMIGASIAWRF